MKIAIEKMFAQLLFWIYDFIDTIGAIFNILTGTQPVETDPINNTSRTLLEVFVESTVTTKVILGLVGISIIIAVACMCVRMVKNIIKIKTDGEATSSHATTVKQGGIAVISSVACIFFVIMFISFSSMLLNMMNDVIAPEGNKTLSQSLFELSVQQTYVIDETKWEERVVGPYYDENGNMVQEQDPTSDDGLAWKTDENGNYELDENGEKQPIWVMEIERYHPYETNANGELVTKKGWWEGYSASDLNWSYKPDQVFGVRQKDTLGIFEKEDEPYKRTPMVRLESFNLLTAYLVAIIMLISMFMLSIGLVKRIYDIVVLFICTPLVCGTIPLDDGARFRAWRETLMSKVLVAFGAVISLNVFFMISGFIVDGKFDALRTVFPSDMALRIFKMVMLLGGAMCINGSQALIARIFGTSADESREAMQSFAMITSGVRLGVVGAMGVGRAAMGAKRMVFGGTNRYGRSHTGILPMGFRGVNALGKKVGGEDYENSRGGRFIRVLGRMGGRSHDFGNNASNNKSNAANRLLNPGNIAAVGGAGHKSNSAFKNGTKKG